MQKGFILKFPILLLFYFICDNSQIYISCKRCFDIFFINDVYLYLLCYLCTESSGKYCFIDDLKEEDIIWTSESVFSKKPLQCLCISFFFFRLLNNKVMVMETPSPQCVGREFVRQYYTLLNEVPLHLHR